ncbi:MAG TPA: YfcE family phosphodiesterase [Pseudomonadales bacterium]|nr:YfcE family phosphodiesterase [Pseudomonadales bacterium]
MRIGVVSDTHDNLKNVARIVALLNDAAVDAVIHTGDISQPKTLDVLAGLDAPLHGVYGNNDVGERRALEAAAARHGFRFADPPLELHWHGRRIIVVHDPLEFDGHLAGHHDFALHGHTHRRRLERAGDTLIFNPGECAGHMQGLNCIGIVDLTAGTAELLHF